MGDLETPAENAASTQEGGALPAQDAAPAQNVQVPPVQDTSAPADGAQVLPVQDASTPANGTQVPPARGNAEQPAWTGRTQNNDNADAQPIYEIRQLPTAASYHESDVPVLECRGLNKAYGGTVALYNVNLTVRTGGVVGLLGPNGSGKSTLIKLAMGMLQPSMGEILICGKRPSPATKAVTAYLPDTPHLPRWMTVEKAFDYVADFFPDFRKDRADELLSRLRVAPKTNLKALSKGNLEKVCLIATMARDAKLYILDEPIAGVDPAARDFILETIICNKPEDSTILLCTHLIADIEPVLSHAIFLNRGQVVLDKDVKDVYAQDAKTLDELFREVFRW